MHTLPEPIAITIESGTLTGKAFTFSKDTISIGRLPSNDVRIPDDPTVSGHHARLVFDGAGWSVEDLGSQNGTYTDTDGARARVARTVTLRLSQRLLVGRTMLAFGHETSAEPVPLTLRVAVTGDRLRYETFAAGAVGASHTCRYFRGDLEELSSRVRAVAFESHSLDRSRDASRREQLLAETVRVGGYMRQHLLPEPVYRQLAMAGSDSLFLSHDPELIPLPWELLTVDDEFLCLRRGLGRQVVLTDHPVRCREIAPGRRLRCLIAADPRDDLPEAQAHAAELLEHIRRRHPEVEVTFLSGSRVQRVDLLSRLSEVDIVYYVGHAVHDPDEPGNSGWLLKRDRITAADFRSLAKAPAVVFANGCQTGEEAAWTGAGPLSYTAYGMASGFMLCGVGAYLGALWPIPIEPSMTFAHEFLARLFEGRPLGECVRRARLRVVDVWGRSELGWAAYALFGDPSRRVVLSKST